MQITATLILDVRLQGFLHALELEVELTGDYSCRWANTPAHCDLTSAVWKDIDLMPFFETLGIVEGLNDHLLLTWQEEDQAGF